MAENSKSAAERRGIRPVTAAHGADTAALVRLGRAAALRSAPRGRVLRRDAPQDSGRLVMAVSAA